MTATPTSQAGNDLVLDRQARDVRSGVGAYITIVVLRLPATGSSSGATLLTGPVGEAHAYHPRPAWLRDLDTRVQVPNTVGQSFDTVTYLADLGADIDQMEQTLFGDVDQYATDTRYVRKDGQWLWCHLSIS